MDSLSPLFPSFLIFTPTAHYLSSYLVFSSLFNMFHCTSRAQTWNIGTCKEVFNVINKVLNPIEYNWKPLLNALLALRTIIYYGSEKAIDLAIELCPVVYKLQDYNSALQKNSRGEYRFN